jgi:hypothetical protein
MTMEYQAYHPSFLDLLMKEDTSYTEQAKEELQCIMLQREKVYYPTSSATTPVVPDQNEGNETTEMNEKWRHKHCQWLWQGMLSLRVLLVFVSSPTMPFRTPFVET